GGAVLPAADQAKQDEQLTATGFLMVGPKVLADRDFVKRKMDVVDEQVDTIGRAFMGLTLGCARCHDHKFDPIPTGDYYSLAGIFKSTKSMENYKVVAMWSERPLVSGDELTAANGYQQKLAEAAHAIKAFEDQSRDRLYDESREKIGSYLLATASADAQRR